MANQFLSLSQLTTSQIQALLALAQRFEAAPISDDLKDKVIGLIFMNPSLRTLASFQTGVSQMGGDSVLIQPGVNSWKLETRDGAVMDGQEQEHIKDAFPVLAEYFDAVGVRCFAGGQDLSEDLADGLMPQFAKQFGKPFINMESAADHPCQALADWKTLDDRGVPREGKLTLCWGWHPRALPFAVPNAVIKMAVQRGMTVSVCNPPGFDLPYELTANSAKVEVTHDRAEAFDGAHAVYVKSWSSAKHYGSPLEVEARSGLRDWCADEDWFAPAQKEALFMHCLPVRRNAEVRDLLIDGPRSVVVEQARNRLHVQKAILAKLMKEEL